VVKLIQLSGGLFLAQSALHLATAQRALLSCCLGCRWFGEAGASPWLCQCFYPLWQNALLPSPGLCLPLHRGYFYPALDARLSESTSLPSWDPGKPCRWRLCHPQGRAVRRTKGCLSRERRDGGNRAPQSPCAEPGWSSESHCEAEDTQMQQLAREGPGSPEPPCAMACPAGRGWQRLGGSAYPPGAAWRTPAPWVGATQGGGADWDRRIRDLSPSFCQPRHIANISPEPAIGGL